MSLLAFFEQLADTPGSVSIHEGLPIPSSNRFTCGRCVCGVTVMLDLRPLGRTMHKLLSR
jgi:hypothetical protein